MNATPLDRREYVALCFAQTLVAKYGSPSLYPTLPSPLLMRDAYALADDFLANSTFSDRQGVDVKVSADFETVS